MREGLGVGRINLEVDVARLNCNRRRESEVREQLQLRCLPNFPQERKKD